MDKKIKIYIVWAVVAVVAITAFVFLLSYWENQPSRFDDFAKCIKDRGAVFYGAFWCPHCQDQKTLFGNSRQYLPYVECSTPDSNGQLPVCKEQKIQSYPTWKFADGTTKEGEVSLRDLAEKTGCQLPE